VRSAPSFQNAAITLITEDFDFRAEMAAARVILDVDVGTDDYMAMLVLLEADRLRQVKIEAVVCSMGNTTIDNVCVNVVRLLELVGRTDIPVYRGAATPLVPPTHEIGLYHGSDGFGGLRHDSTPDLTIIRKEPAAVGVANLVLDNPNQITLICVGPLTNLALSLRLYDSFADSIKELWIMGGNYTALGNVTATAEFNFYMDPEAAYIALDTVKKPIFILTWETCLRPKISSDWRRNVFGAKDNAAIQLLNEAEKQLSRKNPKVWVPCDAFLVAAFLYPDTMITKKSTHNATVELHGSQTRGQIVLDHLKTKRDNVTIIEEVDPELFKQLLMKL
jgi:inosine-uridine nucleoside N-ribohydrolase